MKKMIALLLSIALMLTMAGCGGKKEYLAGTVSDTGVVNIGVPGGPAAMDPARYDGSLAARTVLGMLYQGLTAVDGNGLAVGAAAEGWEISATDDAAERPVYTFTLREDACWSDGTPVKAEDFIAAWTRIISGAVESPCRYLFDVILGAKDYENEESELGLAVTEDGKLQVTLEGDYAGFAHMLAAPAFWPVKEDGSAYNGRYAVAEETESTVTLAPNTGYRGEKPAATLTLKYHYGDMETLEALAADGTLQATFGYAGENIDPTEGSSGVRYYWVMNTEKLAETETRQAVKQLLAGGEATGSLPQTMNALIPGYAAEAAEKLLAVQEKALAAGCSLSADVQENETYKAARDDGSYDLLYLAVSADIPDEAVLLSWFGSGSQANYAKYNNEEFDEMLSKINTETDEAARADLIKGAKKLLKDEGILIPQGEGKTALYCHAALSGITCDMQGLWDFGGAQYAGVAA